jgi:phenylpyruvate tautomerase PptA (4-oxalocrotonate tautomerase family)
MPLIDFSFRQGSLSDAQLDWLLPRLVKVLMHWEKMPDTPGGHARTQLWAHEHPVGRALLGGELDGRPHYRIDVKIPADRLGDLDRAGIVRDFTRLVLLAEGSATNSVEASRVWIVIRDVPADSWGISGHRDWMRDYESALDVIDADPSALHASDSPPPS